MKFLMIVFFCLIFILLIASMVISAIMVFTAEDLWVKIVCFVVWTLITIGAAVIIAMFFMIEL